MSRINIAVNKSNLFINVGDILKMYVLVGITRTIRATKLKCFVAFFVSLILNFKCKIS